MLPNRPYTLPSLSPPLLNSSLILAVLFPLSRCAFGAGCPAHHTAPSNACPLSPCLSPLHRFPVGPPHTPLSTAEPRAGLRLWGPVLPRHCLGGSPTAGVADPPVSTRSSLCAPRSSPPSLFGSTRSPVACHRPPVDAQLVHCLARGPSALGSLGRPVP